MAATGISLKAWKILLPLAGLLASSTFLSIEGQTLEEKHGQYHYRVVRVQNPPTVDGDLSDPAWQGVAAIDQFIQQVPDSGMPATQKTQVRLIYDSTALYIGVYCYRTDPSGIVRNVLRFRDDNSWSKDDIIRFFIDTFHDHRRAYVFATNALGTKQDAQLDNEAWHTNWDEVWDVRTRLQEDGWSAEFRIPFRILRFSSAGDGVWGFNVERWIKGWNERVLWAPIPPGISVTRTASYGHLEGFSSMASERNLQIIPYGLAGVAHSGEFGNTTSDLEIGGDLKLALTSALALDLTYNTNFAQVEADDQQINLTRFSLFFPEKREFFLENAQLFDFGNAQQAQIFFSRRIGLVEGEAVPILGGARLSGRVGAFDLGLLTIQTESHPRAPSTNWSATRLRWNLGPRSYLGGIFTSVSSEAAGNRVFGSDTLLWLGTNLRLQGFLAVVDDQDVPQAPLSFSGALVYDEDLWAASLDTLRVDDQFNPAIGFVRRQGFQQHQGSFRRGMRLNRGWARKLDFSGELRLLTDRQGILKTRQWGIEVSDELDSGDRIRLNLEGNFERLSFDDEAFVVNSREGVVIPPGEYHFNRWLLGFQSFEGRAWVAGAQLQTGDFFGGERTALNLSGTWRASPHLLMGGDYEFNDIAVPQGAFATHLWRGRISVPFTARTTADAFLQWNSLRQELNTQLRFHLIYARESNLFVVFTEQRRDLGGGLIESDWAIQMKLTYRLYW